MIRGIAVGIVLVFTSLALFGQHHVLIQPEKIVVGGTIVLTYEGGSAPTVFAKAKQITAECAEYGLQGTPSVAEILLTKKGNSWTGRHTLASATAFYQLRFRSEQTIDDNGENVWSGMVFGPDGKLVKGAELLYANALMFSGIPGFKMERDQDRALALARSAAEQYPDDWQIQNGYWSMLMRGKPDEGTKARIELDLARVIALERANEEAIASLLVWYERLGKKPYADSLRASAVTANPKGTIARRMRQTGFMMERAPDKRAALIESFVKDFPLADTEKKSVLSQLIVAYVTVKDFPSAFEFINSMPTYETSVDMALNSMAWELAEAGSSVDTAQILAERALKIIRNDKAVPKPSYVSSVDWKRNRRTTLGMTLDTYGYVLSKANKQAEAVKAFEEAVMILGGKEAEINERYMESLVATKAYKRAAAKGAEFVKQGAATEKLVGYYKEAYEKMKGSRKSFESALANEQEVARKEGEKQIMKGMLDKIAPGFALKDLAGKEVTLEGLRGKVVIVDFWATWCGPCKMSFPFLQKVFEQYRSNPDVVILALNTWERVSGTEREQLVSRFLTENKYTFPVLLDENTVTKYGVEGIPTKFVIDKLGKLRFKTVGFDGGEKMMAEMKMQIDLLLSDGFYKGTKK